MLSTLQQLNIGNSAYIRMLMTSGEMRRRLLDIGFVPDAEVTCLFSGFSGDPRAYLIKNTVIALRAEDAETIIIQKGE
ncbi:MAG: ferrous iron transport protein A [Christensenellaceae bacterium]|nr:ferrous iron transport protein A [Christensenellaceae bacterium]